MVVFVVKKENCINLQNNKVLKVDARCFISKNATIFADWSFLDSTEAQIYKVRWKNFHFS